MRSLTHSIGNRQGLLSSNLLQRQVQLQQTERNQTMNQNSKFSRNELDQMRSLTHSIRSGQGLLSSNLLQRQVQLQQTERIHTMNQQGSSHEMNWTKCAHPVIELEIAEVC